MIYMAAVRHMIEKGAERLFLCLDMEYINKRRKDKPNKNNKTARIPIKLDPPIHFYAYSIEILETHNMCLYLIIPYYFSRNPTHKYFISVL